MKAASAVITLVTSAVVAGVVSYAVVQSYWTPERFVQKITEAQDLAQAKAKATADTKFINVIKQNAALIQAPTTPMIGNPDAKTTVIEILDYQCIACREAAPSLASFETAHEKNMRFTFIPLTFIGGRANLPTSRNAAIAALYVFQHDKAAFPAVHQGLFAAQNPLDPQNESNQLTNDVIFSVLAKNAPNDLEAVKAILNNPTSADYKAAEATLSEYSKIIEAIAVQHVPIGTPTFIVAPSNFNATTPNDQFNVMVGFDPDAIMKMTKA